MDKLVFPELLGTVAGDDTILMVLKEDGKGTENRGALMRRLDELVGDTEDGE